MYPDTIRPICLPLFGEENSDLDGFIMVATGWGKTHDGKKSIFLILTLDLFTVMFLQIMIFICTMFLFL